MEKQMKTTLTFVLLLLLALLKAWWAWNGTGIV